MNEPNLLGVPGVIGHGLLVAVTRVGEIALGTLPRALLTTGFLLLGALSVNALCARKVGAALRLLLFAAVFLRLAWPGSWSNPVGLLGHEAPVVSVGPGTFITGPWGSIEASTTPSPSSVFWCGLVYFVVMMGLLARWLAARWALELQLKAARPSQRGGELATAFTRGAVAISEHPTVGPLVAGILRPRIVLPASLVEQADAETLSYVLAHEWAHVRRRDHWLVPAVQLATILAWPVLPLWLAARQIRSLCELASDERVLAGRTGHERRRYGEVLLRLSGNELSVLANAQVPSFGWDLRSRLRALARARRWHLAGQTAFVAGCTGVMLACSGAPVEDSPRTAPHDGRSSSVPDDSGSAAAKGPLRAPTENADTPGRVEPRSIVPAAARGSIDKEVIRKVISDHIMEIKDCYDAFLVTHPKVAGHGRIHFTIGPTGKVQSSSAEDFTFSDPQVGDCSAKRVRDWVFPAPEGGGIVIVEYPFSFSPREEQEEQAPPARSPSQFPSDEKLGPPRLAPR